MSTFNSQEKYSKVWEGIFQNQMWTSIASSHGLNPALVGQDLYTLYDGNHDPETWSAYIVLVTGDKTGDIRFHSKTFLDSLMPHTFCETTNEVFFKNSNITLNIHDALKTPDMIFIDPQKLFSYREKRLCSSYLFWHDSHYSLRTFGPADIVGIGGKASVLKDVSIICGLVLSPPEDAGMREVQQVFCIKSLSGRSVGPLSRIGHVYNGDNCLGWKWIANKPRPLSRIKEE